MSLIAVSGASGFIGSKLCSSLVDRGNIVNAIVRDPVFIPQLAGCNVFQVGEINDETDFSHAIKNIDVIIHTAAQTNINFYESLSSLFYYRRVNVQGTINLARQAVAAKVKRFVFISSVKVNGESTGGFSQPAVIGLSTDGIVGARGGDTEKSTSSKHASPLGNPFKYDDKPAPKDAYGLSKWEAEQGLWDIASQTGMEVVVVRPPIVYGPCVKGNLAKLLNLVCAGVPLPFAGVNNLRSFLGLDNLVDFLIRCVDDPRVAGQTLLVSDGRDLSTPELLHMIANSIGRPARLFPLPVSLLRLGGMALGRLNDVDRLVGSLQIDSCASQEILDWTPPVTVEEGIKRMVMGSLCR